MEQDDSRGYGGGAEPQEETAQQVATKEGRSVLVRNLRYETSPHRVRSVFEAFGQIRDVYLPLDHYTHKPRGFGFVEFCEKDDAERAVREMDRASLDGNKISVIVAQDRRKSPDTMRRLATDNQRRPRDFSDRRREDDRRYEDRRYDDEEYNRGSTRRRNGSYSPPRRHTSHRDRSRDRHTASGGRRRLSSSSRSRSYPRRSRNSREDSGRRSSREYRDEVPRSPPRHDISPRKSGRESSRDVHYSPRRDSRSPPHRM